MDPNSVPPPANPSIEPAIPPKDLKTQVTEASGTFVKNNYEGFLRRLVNIIYAVLKFIKNNVIIMIKMAIGRE